MVTEGNLTILGVFELTDVDLKCLCGLKPLWHLASLKVIPFHVKKWPRSFRDSFSQTFVLVIVKKPLRQHVDQDVTVKSSTETN